VGLVGAPTPLRLVTLEKDLEFHHINSLV